MKGFGYAMMILGSLLTLLICIDFCQNNDSDIKGNDGGGYNVVVIDSCEYLVRQSGYSGYMAHKGNCKFCEIRNKKSKED